MTAPASTFRTWTPTFTMMLVSLISYVDRNTLALLAPTILKENNLSTEQYGYIISAFSYAYMIGNPIWGWLLDKIGVRRGMSVAVSLWTAASVSHVFATGFGSLAAARGLLGFGEGATFPGSLRTVVQTLPDDKRSRGIAIAYSGGALGAVITPWIITPIAAAVGWRGAFWFTGIIGAAWITGWLILSRRPEIRALPATVATERTGGAVSFLDSRIWGFMGCYALGGLPLAFILYNSSLYLGRVYQKSQTDLGWVLWIPPLGWELGYYVWGWLLDRLPRGDAYVPALRKLLGVAAVLSLPLAAIPHIHNYAFTLGAMFFGMLIAAGFVMGSVSYVTRSVSTRNASFIAGLGAGSWSAVVGILSPRFGRLFDQKDYETAFLIASLVPVVGYFIWIALHAMHKPTSIEPAQAA